MGHLADFITQEIICIQILFVDIPSPTAFRVSVSWSVSAKNKAFIFVLREGMSLDK